MTVYVLPIVLLVIAAWITYRLWLGGENRT